MHDSGKPERLVRRKEAIARLSHGKTWFDEHIVRTGRLKFFKVGARSCACKESDLIRLIDEIASGKAVAPAEEKPPLIEARAKLRYRRGSGRYQRAAE